MELTEEQYNQAARYVDGEMNALEMKAFEAAIVRNSELQEEVESYREIRSLGESIRNRLSSEIDPASDGGSDDKDVSGILQQARDEWEQLHEQDLRQELDIPADSYKKSNESRIVESETSVDIPWQGKGQIKKINVRKWLVAAAIIIVVFSGALWWYEYDKKKELRASAGEQRSGPQTGLANKSDSLAGRLRVDTPPLVENHFPNNLALENKEIKKAEQEELVKSNFVPDSLPSEIFDALEAPSIFYKNKQYKEAIVEYKKVLEAIRSKGADLATRSQDENKLTVFLAHYYIGQSYISLGRTREAILELEHAVEQPPGIYWESKAKWYLALANLKAGQIQTAGKLLEQVSHRKDAGLYQQKAIQLNAKLQK